MKLVSKISEGLIDISPACRKALFLRAKHGAPYATYLESDDVETPHQPLAFLAPGTAIGNLVSNGLTASENFYEPPQLRQVGHGALFLMVREACNDAERPSTDGSWREMLLVTDGSRLKINVRLMEDVRCSFEFTCVLVQVTTLGKLVDKIKEASRRSDKAVS